VSQCFEITTSGMIAADELERLLARVLPDCKAVVTQGAEDVPDPFPAIWLRLVASADPDWPCMVRCCAFPDESPWGKYPDLRLAEHLSARFGVKTLCDTNGLVPGLDPQDPYWSLAFADGRWHLADTCGTPLMRPYTDGTRRFPGDQKVKLIREVELPCEIRPGTETIRMADARHREPR
jgi:hypothetical protein